MSDERTDPQPATPACDGMAEDSGSGPSAREGEAGPAPRGRERGYAARRRRRRAAALTPSGRPVLQPPGGQKKVLLHSCCAPCSGEVMEAMTESGIDYTIFFYNPNIHPEREYLLRKEENVRFAEAHGIPFVDADYDRDNWFERAKGMEWEPERGIRCTMCFDMRFERAALYAHEHDFPVMTSSLGISRWKNMAQINECGMRAVAPYEGLDYWDFNWRKGGGSARMIEISKRERFYKQEYCGCAYSLRDTNNFRRAKGRPAIVLGEEFYGEED